MSACCDSRARRERKREREKEREKLCERKTHPLFLWTLCLSVDDQTKRRFQKRWKKKEKRRKFLFLLSPAAPFLPLSASVDSLRSFSSSSKSSSDSYWNQWIMNAQTLYLKCWLWCARALLVEEENGNKSFEIWSSLSRLHTSTKRQDDERKKIIII